MVELYYGDEELRGIVSGKFNSIQFLIPTQMDDAMDEYAQEGNLILYVARLFWESKRDKESSPVFHPVTPIGIRIELVEAAMQKKPRSEITW